MKTDNDACYNDIQEKRKKMLIQLRISMLLKQKEEELKKDQNSIFDYLKGFTKSLKNIYLLTQKDMLSLIPKEAEDIIKKAQKDVIKYTLLIEEKKKNAKSEEDVREIEELMRMRDNVINKAYNQCKLYLTPVQQRYYDNNKRDIHQEFFSFDYEKDKKCLQELKKNIVNKQNNKKSDIVLDISINKNSNGNEKITSKHTLNVDKNTKQSFYR